MNKEEEDIEFEELKQYRIDHQDEVKVYEFWDIVLLPFNLIIRPFKKLSRTLKIKRYKHKRIRIEKQSGLKTYQIDFRIIIDDADNPKVSSTVYRMEVPAHAAILAKIKLRESIKKKIDIEMVNLESLDE